MKALYKQIIQRQDELIKHYKLQLTVFDHCFGPTSNHFESEIKFLKSELEKETEITDADIEAWAEDYLQISYHSLTKGFIKNILIMGARAMRNGEIKPTEK